VEGAAQASNLLISRSKLAFLTGLERWISQQAAAVFSISSRMALAVRAMIGIDLRFFFFTASATQQKISVSTEQKMSAHKSFFDHLCFPK